MKKRIRESGLWFILGAIANISIFKIAGNTIFTYCLYLYPLIFAAADKKIQVKKNGLGVYAIVSFISVIFCLCNGAMENWYMKAIVSFMNIILSYILFFYLTCKEEMLYYFINGLYYGAIAHLVFWIMQVITWKIFNMDLNSILFGVTSQFKDHEIVYSGLAIHAGILVPTLVVAILLSDKFYLKIMFMIFGCYTRNTTTLLTICFYLIAIVCVDYAPCLLAKMKAMNLKKIFQIVCGILVFLLVYQKTQFSDVVNNSFERVFTVANGEFTSGSDATHMRYLTSFPYIIKNTKLINILFGNGVGTSGFVMSKFFNQYTDMVWTIECDWLDIFYSVGAIGWLIIYGNLLFIAIVGYKINRKYTIYAITIIASGAFYNFHLYWLIIFEFILSLCIKNKIDIWNYREFGNFNGKGKINESATNYNN